jgi:hypothetical protein
MLCGKYLQMFEKKDDLELKTVPLMKETSEFELRKYTAVGLSL